MLALLTVFNSWAFMETRRRVQVFPEQVQKLWNNWELRVLVLVSLTLQLCLLHFGSHRRYSVKTWLSVFLWLSYIGADSVATVALGVISNNQRNCNDSQLQNELMAFWAPFLLLHLGGQDTITAYAVQDNELWLRHLLGLFVQSGVALYIILFSWKFSWLSFATIPMFLAGFIKYAERTWALKSANYDLSFRRINSTYMGLASGDSGTRLEPTSRNINKGIFQFFKIVRCLFLNQKVDIANRLVRDYSNFRDSQTAWNTIEGELGYAYDVYYTKAPLFFTTWGFLIRFFSSTSILFVFVLFLMIERHKHPVVDLIITYLLLVGAILMEIYAVILLSASDWPFRRQGEKLLGNCIKTLFTPIRNGFAKLTSKQRWSKSMGQLNLLGLCLKVKSLQDGHGTPELSANLRDWAFSKMLPKLNGELVMLLYMTDKEVSDKLKELVFNAFKEKLELKKLAFNTFKEKLSSKSNGFPEKYNKYTTNGTEGVETYQSIIIWHIATDLCFYTDSGTEEGDLSLKVMSKDVSDYMMYILVMLPVVLSTGNAKRSFESTCRAVEVALNKLSKLPIAEVCKSLILSEIDSDSSIYNSLLRDRLFDLAVLLAQDLNGTHGKKWKILSKFWVETLAYVATLCQGNNHAQLLRKGGEFLTHVWLLQEHFNLTETVLKSIMIDKRPQEVSSVVGNDESAVVTIVDIVTGSESGASATGSAFESGYGQSSGNGSTAVSGADASTTSKSN